MKSHYYTAVALAVSALNGSSVCAADPDGLLLVTPLFDRQTVVLNPAGEVVHSWPSNFRAAASARILPDGGILRLGHSRQAKAFFNQPVRGGQIEIINRDGSLRWSSWDATDDQTACGDALMLPNGNVLTAVAEYHTKEDCIAQGREDHRISEHGMFFPGLIEFKPTGRDGGTPVWRWSAWKHVGQARHPALPNYHFPKFPYGIVDINGAGSASSPQWYSIRQLAYDANADIVVAVIAPFGDIWVIDHSTTPSEAESDEGGRWGQGGRIGSLQRSPAKGAPILRLHSASFSVLTQISGQPPGIELSALGYTSGENVAKVWSLDLRHEEKKWVFNVRHQRELQLPPSSATERHPDGMEISADGGSAVFARSMEGQFVAASLAGTSPITLDHWRSNTRGRVKARSGLPGKSGNICCGGADVGPPDPNLKPILREISPIGTPQPISPSLAAILLGQ